MDWVLLLLFLLQLALRFGVQGVVKSRTTIGQKDGLQPDQTESMTDPGMSPKGDSVDYGAKSVDEDECAILTHAVEAYAQGGRASPMDSSTCAHGGCIVLSDKVEEDLNWLYSRKLNDVSWEVHSVDLGDIDDVWLVIGSTGVHAPTSEQVAKVAALLEKQPEKMREIETIGIVARRGIAALMKGDMESVGRAMSENHLLLRSIGVSCPELESLITAAAPHHSESS